MPAAAGSGIKAIRGLQTSKFADPAIEISLEAAIDVANALDEACKTLKEQKTGAIGLQATEILRELEEKAADAVRRIVMLKPGPTACTIGMQEGGDVRVSINLS